jgi:hypothetical protein
MPQSINQNIEQKARDQIDAMLERSVLFVQVLDAGITKRYLCYTRVIVFG